MNNFFIKILVGAVVVASVMAAGSYYWRSETTPKQNTPTADYKNTTFLIEGVPVTLKNGAASTPAAPGSASTVETKYFGNELATDLNGDGREDVAFIVTQSGGGSGTFYYAVAAIKTEEGYVGSDGYLLGDRIAPQSTNLSQNLRHQRVVVFNYADRNVDEPMTTSPSIGKSAYLKIDPDTLRWGIVIPDFEGESDTK
jgi:hypothetical protein